MHKGEGIVVFGSTFPTHGDIGEYAFATIPPVNDSGWGPAPNPDTIGYFMAPSTLCFSVNGVANYCRNAADFTYFQTLVDIPSNVVVTTFTISFSSVDDGARTTIFNSDNPTGAVVPGSYVFLGGTGTANLASLVKAGEVNRVVVTHTDDCCFHASLSGQVVLNGKTLPKVKTVKIDIKPGSFPNSINCKQPGITIPVAVLSDPSFDATQIDLASVDFAGSNKEIHNKLHTEDVNKDGLLDAVFHFRLGDTMIKCGDTEACLTGKTVAGVQFKGCDSVRTVNGAPPLNANSRFTTTWGEIKAKY
jgi:hypothetical protein